MEPITFQLCKRTASFFYVHNELPVSTYTCTFQTGSATGLRESLQPCSRAARKWRENEEMKRKWRENEEIERKWRENEEMERK